MFTFLIFVHVILCISLISLVLIQQGKGADMGAAFGGGANTIFGAGGATQMIVKITTGVAIAFMLTSILLIRSYKSGVTNFTSRTQAEKDIMEGSTVKEVGESMNPQVENAVKENSTTEKAVAPQADNVKANEVEAQKVAPESVNPQPVNPEPQAVAPQEQVNPNAQPVAPQ